MFIEKLVLRENVKVKGGKLHVFDAVRKLLAEYRLRWEKCTSRNVSMEWELDSSTMPQKRGIQNSGRVKEQPQRGLCYIQILVFILIQNALKYATKVENLARIIPGVPVWWSKPHLDALQNSSSKLLHSLKITQSEYVLSKKK